MSVEKLHELKTLASVCPELNMANYTENDVRHLNDWAIEMSLLVEQYALSQQPAQAAQAEVTDEQIKEAATKAVKERNLSWVWFEKDDQDKYTIPILSESHYQLVRAGLTLRPERVPMTDEQISLEAHNADDRDWNDLRFRSSWHEGFLEGARFAEAHHGITAKEKGVRDAS